MPPPVSRRNDYNSRMYSAKVLDHFQNPRNGGDLPNADAWAQVENPACGDVLKLSVRVSDGRVSAIRFRAKGCVPAMACGSALTELVLGKTVEEAGRMGVEELVRDLGGLPEASTHASHLAMDALAGVLAKISTPGGS